MLVSQIRDTHLQEHSSAFNGNSGQLFFLEFNRRGFSYNERDTVSSLNELFDKLFIARFHQDLQRGAIIIK